MSRLLRLAASAAATAVVLTPALTAGSAHAAAASYPSGDSFYRYTATGTPYVPDAGTHLGDVLDTRTVNLPVMADLLKALAYSSAYKKDPATAVLDSFAIKGTQLLYRTQDELAHPSATVTTVLRPEDLPKPVASKGVVAYLSYYDGLSDTCDPSYTLQNGTIDGEKAAISQLLESGYTVTIPDFEGEGLDWAAGHEAGWSTLDAIRATETSLGLDDAAKAATKVATVGYSGGSIAGEWAAELQPTYATDINLVGTAIGGVPANLRHLVDYVNSDADADRDSWFGVIPAATVSLGRAVGLDFSSYLNDTGKQIASTVATKCIGDFAKNYPGMHLKDLLADPTKSFLDQPDVKTIVDGLEMGKGTPSAPMFMVNGRNSTDHIGDGVMVADDVKALAATYCSRGIPVNYDEETGLHSAVGQTFIVKAIGLVPGGGFIDKWFDGTATSTDYNCAPRVITDPPLAAHLSLKGHSRGHQDVLVVRVGKTHAGDRVRVLVAGHHQAVGHARIAKNGTAKIAVLDRNGKHTTRYQVLVAGMKKTITLR